MKSFLAKERGEVLRKWRANELSYIDAIAQLVRLGYSVEEAAQLLANCGK